MNADELVNAPAAQENKATRQPGGPGQNEVPPGGPFPPGHPANAYDPALLHDGVKK